MFQTLKVSKIVKETGSTVSILFEVAPSQKQSFQYQAGQFLTLKQEIKGQEIRRSYSLCSAPNSGQLKVAIKKIEGGVFSTYAVDELVEGDEIEVGAPAGKFTVNCAIQNQRKYVFVSAGSGITPSISMIKTILIEEPKSSIHLLYGNKTKEETIFFNEIEQLKKQYGSRFDVKYFFSREHGMNELTSGRISVEKLKKVMPEWGQVKEVYGFYVCGPEQLIEEVTGFLVDEGVREGNVHFELFTSKAIESNEVVDELVNKDDENSQQQQQQQKGEKQETFEWSKITADVDDVDYTFEVKPGRTILSAALAAGVDIPYSCQGGVCGSCECTVTEGKVDHSQNMILSEEELEEGQALACQAVPRTAEVKLTFDY